MSPGALLLLASVAVRLEQGKIELQPGDTIPAILKRQIGQLAELRLKSGEKLVGRVQKQNEGLVHLSGLAGTEFHDAVVCLDDIAAVLVRTKAR